MKSERESVGWGCRDEERTNIEQSLHIKFALTHEEKRNIIIHVPPSLLEMKT